MFPTQKAVVNGVALPVAVVENSDHTLDWRFASADTDEWSQCSEVRCTCGSMVWDCCDLGANWANGKKPETFRFWLSCRVCDATHQMQSA